MDVSAAERGAFTFGPFLLDPLRRCLTRQGEPVKLTPTRFDTLLYLVANAGRLVEKDELLAAVWPGRSVEEANLTQTISTVRRALQEVEPGAEHYIATAPGRGYRFAEAVRRIEPSPRPPAANEPAPRARCDCPPAPISQPCPRRQPQAGRAHGRRRSAVWPWGSPPSVRPWAPCSPGWRSAPAPRLSIRRRIPSRSRPSPT
jgi:DNA-binding winged helix-turn-helix (wHTH) protein